MTVTPAQGLSSKWQLVLFGFAMCLFSSAGQTFFISFFATDIRETFVLSHGQFGTLYSIATLISAALLIWAGRMIDHLPLTRVTQIVLVGLCLACLMMSFSTHWLWLVCAIFALRLFGQGLSSHTAMTAMGRYFNRNRGRAISIAALGHSAGEAVLPVLLVGAIMVLGWQQSWGATALIIGLGALSIPLLVRRLPAPQAVSAGNAGDDDDVSYTLRQVLSDLRLWLRLPSLLAPSFIYTGVIFHQLHLAEEKGWSELALASAYTPYALAAVLTTLAGGWLIDRFSARRLLVGFLVPLIAALAVIVWLDGSGSLVAFMILLGVSAGLALVELSAIWPELYGTRHLGAIKSFAQAAMVFSTGLAPGIMGLLIDSGWLMQELSLMSIIYCCLAMACAGIASIGNAKRPQKPVRNLR